MLVISKTSKLSRNQLSIQRHHFLKSKTKEPQKLLSSPGMSGGKSISVNNFSAQEHASSKNRHVLNFIVIAVRDVKL